MKEINKVKDAAFLKELDLDNLRNYLVKIVVLDSNEIPLQSIEGRVTAGSITIDGSSAVRRAGSITFVAEGDCNDLTNIDNLFSINKKIQIFIGLENHVDRVNYDDIIWFKQGIFVIVQPSISHSINSVTINLQIKDKMCLLNGEMGGNLPTSVTFDSYDQIMGYMEVDEFPSEPLTTFVYKKAGDTNYYIWETNKGWTKTTSSMIGDRINVKQRIFDIIQTAVCNYGNEDIAKIIINDVPLELKQIVRYTGSGDLYYNSKTGVYSLDIPSEADAANWIHFDYNQDCGYVYTDFTYPGELVTSIGDNVCSVLEKIKSQLGNYEYFYDIDGNFIFQEKKNYLNTTYDPIQYYNSVTQDFEFIKNSILDEDNFMIDYSNTGEVTYDFKEGNALATSYTNNPSYINIKNDFHIWGKNNDNNVIHYHVVIKEKPKVFNAYKVEYEKDNDGNYTGKVLFIEEVDLAGNDHYYFDEDSINFDNSEAVFLDDLEGALINESVDANFNNTTQTLELVYHQAETEDLYIPTDWRAEIYMQGLAKKAKQIRPDVYEQELLDLWDGIYDMRLKKFKADIVNHPNDLTYWIDYIEPVDNLHDISVDSLGTKIYSYQQENVRKIYNTDIPDRILINLSDTALQRSSIMKKCEQTGQSFSNVSSAIYSQISIGTYGYVAQETARELLYQYTDYNASISINSIPIYYLEPNTRITVNDNASGIHGDYVIKSISMPLDGKSTMSISATKALRRF